MSSYAKNTDRPATASVAQVEDTSGTDTHDPYDGNSGSLESGGGGSVDLSAVDQDIGVLNGHAIDFQGDIVADSEAHASVAWDDNNFGLTVAADAARSSTELYVVSPVNPAHYAYVYGGEGLTLGIGFNGAASESYLQLGPRDSVTAQGSLETRDIRHVATTGPILVAPDASLHRLIVANDGTLSTEPVV